MSECRDLELLLASDDRADLARAGRHALECPDCRAVYDAQKRLAGRIEAWDPAVDPPPALEDRVRGAVRRRLAAPDLAAGRAAGSGSRGRWLALAAALFLAVALGFWIGLAPNTGPTQAENLLVTGALADARRAEREHARAIASLEEAVDVRLARADDPKLPAAEAAILLAYRDRLAALESTIEEVQDYLRQNPAHPGARTVLLAAYRDKTEVLREVLALGETT